MGDGISINLGDSLPYILESVLELVGKDAATREWKLQLSELVKLSAEQASAVQCVGMPQPIPITDIYQRTTLRRPPRGKPQTFERLIESQEDALIFAGPGWGKTTLLHWMYVQLANAKVHIPLLFTLRWPGIVEQLKALVTELERGRAIRKGKTQRVILLVDGYDEIAESQRQEVSQALMLFSSLGIGNFYLTCRSHYDVYDLKRAHMELTPFSSIDAERFVRAYCKAYGADVDARALLQELDEHHLGEFACHPLMLTLVCILKSGPGQQIPRRAIGLLRRAIDTLTFRWDEAKRVHRESAIPLDGEERVWCLMRIAFEMNSPQERWDVVQRGAAEHLSLIQMKHVSARTLLEEMARFYGLLVPVGEDYWQFTHRTIHDYLSARYWVESGKFNPDEILEWDVHAAYAACLTADATQAMSRMLKADRDIPAFVECLYNSAPFDPEVIAVAIIVRVQNATKLVDGARTLSVTGGVTRVRLKDDFLQVCSDEFLRILFNKCVAVYESAQRWDVERSRESAIIVGLCSIGELLSRKAKIKAKHVDQFLILAHGGSKFECSSGNSKFLYSLADLKTAAGVT
jgi:hypothetical protein